MINFINITFCFSFLCRKLKGLRHREETKLSWYVLITSSQILHYGLVTASDYQIPIFTCGWSLGRTNENILKWEGESLVPVSFP